MIIIRSPHLWFPLAHDQLNNLNSEVSSHRLLDSDDTRDNPRDDGLGVSTTPCGEIVNVISEIANRVRDLGLRHSIVMLFATDVPKEFSE